MSNDLFQKVVDTVTVGSGDGGILSPEQTNRFIDYMWDATALGQDVRQIRMRAPVTEIDKMDLGQRLARHATEAVDDGVNVGPTFSKIQLTTEKIRLDWELSSESLEDNIEGGNLEDHIARLMATQLGNDLEDLAINGDVDRTAWGNDAQEQEDNGAALMTTFDGYLKRARNGGATVLSAGTEEDGTTPLGISTSMFNRAYKALPRKFKRRSQLRFYTGSAVLQDYHQALIQLGIENGVTFPWVQGNGPGAAPTDNGGATNLAPFGIPLYEIPLFDQAHEAGGAGGFFVLTHPQNHLWGVKREIKVYRRFAEKKDAIEYTVFTRQGVQIDNLDAYVIVEGIQDEDYNV